MRAALPVVAQGGGEISTFAYPSDVQGMQRKLQNNRFKVQVISKLLEAEMHRKNMLSSKALASMHW